MNTRLRLETASIALALAVSIPALAHGFPGQQQFGSQAKIALKQAKKIALKTYHGKIVSEELEKEHGGSGLRYSFDIRHGKVTHEVGVDAKTGKVLENSVEDESDSG
jgi:uncharacterized membrane protein YkoI